MSALPLQPPAGPSDFNLFLLLFHSGTELAEGGLLPARDGVLHAMHLWQARLNICPNLAPPFCHQATDAVRLNEADMYSSTDALG